jgi:hypothetical protein
MELIVIFIIFLMLLGVYSAHIERTETRPKAYKLWKETTGIELTYEEWDLLRSQNALPTKRHD